MSWKQWLFSCTGVYDCMTVKWVKDLYEVVWVLILCFVVSLGKVEWSGGLYTLVQKRI